MNFTYLIKYLWKKKWIILIPTAAAVMAAWFFSIRESHTYTSVAELSTGYMEVNPLEDNRFPNNTVLFNNVIQTLQSSQVLDQISYSLLLHDLGGIAPFRTPANKEQAAQIETSYPGGKAGLMVSLNNKADSFYVLDLAKAEDRKIGELAGLYGYSPESILNSVQIKRIEGTDFIDITAQTGNPEFSALLANSICRSFLGFYHARMGQASSVSLDTLKNMMDAKKQILDNKLKILQGETNISGENTAGLLSAMQAQLTQQKTNLIQAQASLENDNQQINAASQKGGGLANNEDIITLRTNIDNLYSKYVNGGSTDAALLSQINRMRNEYQQKLNVVNNTPAGVSMGDLLKRKNADQVQVNVAQQIIKELQQKINELGSSVQSATSKGAVVDQLQNEVELARQDYASASALYNSALNRNIFPGNNFKQSLIASPPLYPDASKKIKILGLTGAGVFFVLVFLLLFIDFIDTSIKAPSFLKDSLPVPLLANLERINLKNLPVEGIFSANGSLPKRKHGFREQIKQLRYEVESSGKKIFLVAGYHAGSGRTTLIRALAGSLSLNKRKVLLVDINFQHNSLTRHFNATTFLESFDGAGGADILKQRLAEITTTTGDENVLMIGCEPGSHTPEEALPKNNVFTFLRSNDREYDYVLVDCAALSKGPDCKELLQYVDAVILMFAADQVLSDESKKFNEFLKKRNIYTLGMVLNRINSYSTDL
jgi:Mrp family chromosome partitioning ATPase/uncharacterized protein involved in exopolysaccharide biosynthesis